jgi:hypothetical protein
VSAQLVLVFAVLLAAISSRGAADTVAWWDFEEGQDRVVVDRASGTEDELLGNFKYVQGSQGGSHFRWRDHWPTTTEPTPGRDASGTQAAHGSFFHIMRIPMYQQGKDWVSKVLLHGMTKSGVGELAPLAKSWLYDMDGKYLGGAYFVYITRL